MRRNGKIKMVNIFRSVGGYFPVSNLKYGISGHKTAGWPQLLVILENDQISFFLLRSQNLGQFLYKGFCLNKEAGCCFKLINKAFKSLPISTGISVGINPANFAT